MTIGDFSRKAFDTIYNSRKIIQPNKYMMYLRHAHDLISSNQVVHMIHKKTFTITSGRVLDKSPSIRNFLS